MKKIKLRKLRTFTINYQFKHITMKMQYASKTHFSNLPLLELLNNPCMGRTRFFYLSDHDKSLGF